MKQKMSEETIMKYTFLRYPGGKTKAVTLSYDDGNYDDIRLLDILNRYGLKCTFNLNSELLSKKGMLIREGKRIAHYKIHTEDVKHIYEGHEVAVHTLTHPNLTQCDDKEIIRQVEADRLNLSELVEYEVVGMAYPCGGVNNDDRVAGIIKKNTGVKYSRTITTNNCFDLQENLYRFNPTAYHLDFEKMMQLGREFVEFKPKEPKVFYIWGHSYEMDYCADYWVKLEEFFKLISNKEDIFYGTNKEVLL
jgi:peptidoglycan/xylan/chitin deacetylase (PgdA/CDA1 family)